MPLNNTFILDVDIKEVNYAYERKVTANDSITFIINLTNEGLPLDLSSVTTVSLAHTRLDQVTVVTPGTKTGANQVTFKLGQNETKTPGRVGAVVQLYDADGRVSMLGFNYTVIADPTGDNYIPPGSDQTLIQVIMGDGPLVIAKAEQATVDADTATADARTAIQSVTNTINALNDNMDSAIADMNTTVNNNIAAVNNDMKITHKGTVATYANLPTSGRQTGDTWVVTSDGTAANNGVWRWQSNSTWLKINNLNLSGAETVSNVGVVAKATADIVRQSVPSGVLDYDSSINSAINGSVGGKGQAQVVKIGDSVFFTNRIAVKSFNTLINGFKCFVNKWVYTGSSELNYIDFPEPPTFGTREDLVFLEAWFPQNGNGYELSWRIRTVAGVDFNNYLDGMSVNTITNQSPQNLLVTAQGGNSSPTTFDSINFNTSFYPKVTRTSTSTTGKKIALDDEGLYLAGDGTQTSKDLLKTLDGYVYAIPLFRIKRRNSGGYRKDNLNGARDYKSIATLKVRNGGSYSIGNSITLYADSTNGLKVGDTLAFSASPKLGTVVEILNSTDFVLKIDYIYGGSSTTVSTNDNWATNVWLASDRPDSQFANIISDTDIIDLRHKVSLTGFNHQQLLEENFDLLLQGKLTTKDTKTTAKEVFNLVPAPLGLKQELAPVKVKGNDGVERELVNLLGTDGSFEQGTTIATGWQINSGTIVGSVQSSDVLYGSKSQKVTFTQAGDYFLEKYLSSGFLKVDKYYLVVANAKSSVQSNGFMRIFYNSDSNFVSTADRFTTSWKSYVLKFKPTVDGHARIRFYANAGLFDLFVDGVRIYEIDQATYDKIDVLPEFTGEELAKKFPYVDSYPNFVENLVPSFDSGKWTIPAGVTVSNPYTLSISGSSGQYYMSEVVVPALPNTTYTISGNSPAIAVRENNSSNGALHVNKAPFTTTTFTTSASCTTLYIQPSTNGTSGSFTISSLQLEIGATQNQFVPYGRYYLPYDYANGATKHYIAESLSGQRSIFSDAQTSETRTDKIEVLRTPQKHIKVTQATEGQWSVGDTIAVKASNGVVSGVIDSDTASSKVMSATNGSQLLTLDDVSKFSVNDKFALINPDGSTAWASLTISAIDTTSKTITISEVSAYYGGANGCMIVEITASTSSPVVTATGIAGNWTGLGTKEATYTITTAPTDNKTDILIQYSVNYPAGKGIVNVPSDVLEGEVNGQKLVKTTGNVVLRDNFVGKVSGNTDACPHLLKYSSQNSLQNPITGTWAESSTPTKITTLDNDLYSGGQTSVNGTYAQHLFSFNLIEICERKFGEGFFADCVTVADKVAKLKSGLAKITYNWHGYGNSPTGNKANAKGWYANLNNWSTGVAYHTNGTVSKLTAAYQVDVPNIIDSNGFYHLLVYAEPATGNTGDPNGGASTIYTDYVEIELEINPQESGYTVLAPENQMPVLSENLLMSNQAFPVDLSGFEASNSRLTGTSTISVDSVGVLKVVTTATAYQGVATSNASTVSGYVTASFEIKADANVSLEGYIASSTSTSSGSTTFSSFTSINATSNWQRITVPAVNMSNGTPTLVVRQTTATATNFYIRNLKINKGSTATPWTQGLNKKKILNYLGKVAGSTVENPHRAYTNESSSFIVPSGTWYNPTQTEYDNLIKQDGGLWAKSTVVNGAYRQQLFEFDLSHLGLSLTELKKALRKLTVSWTGYGSGSNAGVLTNGATKKFWNASTSSWVDMRYTTDSVPASIVDVVYPDATNTAATITKDQKFYVLVHSTYPSNSTIPSEIYTDYIKLEVELSDTVDLVKSNILLVRPETKEVKLKYPAKSYKLMGNGGGQDQVAVHYRYVPYQGINSIGGKILARKTLALTLGTGKYNKEELYFRNAIAKLPMPLNTKDSDFTGSSIKLKDNAYTYTNNWIIPITTILASYWNGSYSEIHNEHLFTDGNVRSYRVGNVTRGYGNGAKDTSEYISPDYVNPRISSDGKMLFVDAFITLYGSEIRLELITGVDGFSAWNNAIDGFYVSGRPLIKS